MPVSLVRLVPASPLQPDADGHAAHVGHGLGDEGEAVGEGFLRTIIRGGGTPQRSRGGVQTSRVLDSPAPVRRMNDRDYERCVRTSTCPTRARSCSGSGAVLEALGALRRGRRRARCRSTEPSTALEESAARLRRGSPGRGGAPRGRRRRPAAGRRLVDAILDDALRAATASASTCATSSSASACRRGGRRAGALLRREPRLAAALVDGPPAGPRRAPFSCRRASARPGGATRPPGGEPARSGGGRPGAPRDRWSFVPERRPGGRGARSRLPRRRPGSSRARA